MTAQVGDYVKATYDFPGEATTDLPLSLGDVVKIVDVVDDNWATGEKLGTTNITGSFPWAFVEKISLPSIRTGQKIFLATQDFPADQSGDLELTKGDLITGIEAVDDSWWKGKSGPLKGIFPLAFVVELEVSDGLRSRSASARSGSLRSRSSSTVSYGEVMGGSVDVISAGITKAKENTFARALVDVSPQLDGELAFQLGDLIEITEILDADWFYGRCRNKEGLVSAVCVELLDDGGDEGGGGDGTGSEYKNDQADIGSDSHYSYPHSYQHNDDSEAESRLRGASSGSYTSENTRSHDVEITPYGRVLYPFTAQIPTELTLTENQIVTLIQHVDEDWTEGEADGKRGLFPSSFIEIIVDCPYTYDQTSKEYQPSTEPTSADDGQGAAVDSSLQSTAAHENLKHDQASTGASAAHGRVPPKNEAKAENIPETAGGNISAGIAGVFEISENHEIGLVVYDFVAEVSEDVSVKEGDTVEVIKRVDENWLQIQTEDCRVGQVPASRVEIIGPWPKARSESSTGSTSSSASVQSSSTVTSDTARAAGQSEQDSGSHVISTNTEPSLKETETKEEMKDRTEEAPVTSTDNQAREKPELPPPLPKTAPPDLPPPLPKTAPPGGKPAIPPKTKPPLLPKPALAPKPALPSKPAVIPSKSFLTTAKPFTPSSTQTRRVRPPLEKQRNSLASLDSLVEEEFVKAKSRSSSENSDITNASLAQNNTSASSESTSVCGSLTAEDLHAGVCGVSDNERVAPTTVSAAPSTDTSVDTRNVDSDKQENTMVRTTLTSSMSLTEDVKSNLAANDRRKSASIAEQKMYGSPKVSNGKEKSFVNKAFQMEVDEGHLVDISNNKSRTRNLPPARAPPPRPTSAIVSATPPPAQTSSTRPKGPPPRPVGPRIAPAPSKTPLVPTKAELPPKLIPKRPAPRAPVPANKDRVDQNQNMSVQTQPAVQPPRRHPPRPTSFPTPPRRPPPRPADLMSFSPETPEDETNKELIADLKTKLEENKADIKKYEQTLSELRNSLSQTESQEKEAETKDNLDFVEKTLGGLREERRTLEESLFTLSPREARLEKARLLAAQHAEEEEKRKEEEKRRAKEMKARRRDQRAKVIEEIMDTEKDYLFSLQLCLETFLDGQKPPSTVDLDFLLGNMEEIADVSQKMLVDLETCVSGKSFEDQCVGKCFSSYAEDMKNTYAPYCRNHDGVITAMEQYQESPEISKYFTGKLEKMREQMNVFDVAGVLIKPVQRILKYPLLLNELLKNTEDDHPDRTAIVAAIQAMTDVAKAINEYKRRKDLVYKYKKFSDQTFSDKISKLNLHSIKKKSSRFRGRLSQNFGLSLQMRDEIFEKEEAKFRNLEKAVKVFLRSVQLYLEQSHEAMKCQETFADDIMNFYKGKECEEVTKLHEVTGKLLDLFANMKQTIENVVVVPLTHLVGLFSAPGQVIEKRFDKLLDYNHQLGRNENDKELQAAKNDYEAMNAQLLDELPKFYNLAFNLLQRCISVFVLARRDYMDQSLKESCALLGLSSMASKSNMMETFNIHHTTEYDQMSLLSFIPRGFNPRVDALKADKAKQRGRQVTENILHHQNASQMASTQNDSQRMYLRQLYPTSKLYTVTITHKAHDLMDIALSEGMMVGVVKELDPMGNKDRWFVDDGVNKGFAPSNILTPVGSSPSGSMSSLPVEEDVLSMHSYDSGENVVLSGNDGRAEYHAGGSSVETSPQQQQSSQQQQQQQYQYYYALYDFKSRHPNEASLIAGHPVTVLAFQDLDGNSEWWLVDSEGNRGYAPANYMAPVPYS